MWPSQTIQTLPQYRLHPFYKKGWNYYFTPLGKSWVCVKAADQGTLRLYNVDDEIIGNMTLYNIKVQPFVKRAKGKWGEGNF